MTPQEIKSLGWKRDYNLDGEEHPSLFEAHGYSIGFSIDTQLEDDKCHLLYVFPDHFVVIERIVKCSMGKDDRFELGYIININELEPAMDRLNIPRIYCHACRHGGMAMHTCKNYR